MTELPSGSGVPSSPSGSLIYEGNPQWMTYFGHYLFAGVFDVLGVLCILLWALKSSFHSAYVIVPAIVFVGIASVYFLIVTLVRRSIHNRITTVRIEIERGVFNRKIDTMELWQVSDLSLRQSFFERIFHLGTIEMVTTHEILKNVEICGISEPRPVFDQLKDAVFTARREHGVIRME